MKQQQACREDKTMNGLIYLIGLVVIVVAILSLIA